MLAGLAGPSLCFGTLYGSEFDPETKCRESFVIAETVDLDRNETYAKERALIDEVKAQFARGRKCQVFAVYTAAALLGGAGRGGSGGQGN